MEFGNDGIDYKKIHSSVCNQRELFFLGQFCCRRRDQCSPHDALNDILSALKKSNSSLILTCLPDVIGTVGLIRRRANIAPKPELFLLYTFSSSRTQCSDRDAALDRLNTHPKHSDLVLGVSSKSSPIFFWGRSPCTKSLWSCNSLGV
jgi:hypothetical protein